MLGKQIGGAGYLFGVYPATSHGVEKTKTFMPRIPMHSAHANIRLLTATVSRDRPPFPAIQHSRSEQNHPIHLRHRISAYISLYDQHHLFLPTHPVLIIPIILASVNRNRIRLVGQFALFVSRYFAVVNNDGSRLQYLPNMARLG